MTEEQLKFLLTQDCYREHEQIGNTITPIYRVRVCKGGILRWFDDFHKLANWMTEL